jgi:hypothetical protein
MTRRRRSCSPLALSGAFFAAFHCAACTTSLPAVSATGASGRSLQSDTKALDAIPALCLEIAALSGANEDCAGRRDEARFWTAVVVLLETYGSALSAAGRGAPDRALLPAGVGQLAWRGVAKEDAAAAGALAEVTKSLETEDRDASAVRRAVDGADKPLQQLAKSLDALVGKNVADIDLAEASVDVVRQRLQEVAGAPPPPASRPQAQTASGATAKADKGARPAKTDCVDVIVPTVEAIGARLSALYDAMNRQTGANQVVVPGSLAGLAAVQADLEGKRAAFERLRTGLGVFARAHGVLAANLDELSASGLIVKVQLAAEEPAKVAAK